MAEQLDLLGRASEATDEVELDEDQLDAFTMLAFCPVGIITGGPGRGKTRTLQAALPYMQGRVALCAPSGKAARRMAELTGRQAMTVHRLLGLHPGEALGEYHAGNPLPYDAVVVDEASTLDAVLCAQLLDACDPTRTRVLFVGDVDQLPSVGPGHVLHDLIASRMVPVVRLKTMHRAARDSWVCRASPQILSGQLDLEDAEDFRFVPCDSGLVEAAVQVTRELVAQVGRDSVQVMAPMNVGDFGTMKLNAALQAALNKPGLASVAAGANRLCLGDPVVATDNDYDRNVFNGETGRVVAMPVDAEDDAVRIDFGDRVVDYTRRAAGERLRLAYALSVHRMQGSEIPWVVLVLHEQHAPLLHRKLLYTAVTRARQGVVIVGQRAAVRRALQNEEPARRTTTLLMRMVTAP